MNKATNTLSNITPLRQQGVFINQHALSQAIALLKQAKNNIDIIESMYSSETIYLDELSINIDTTCSMLSKFVSPRTESLLTDEDGWIDCMKALDDIVVDSKGAASDFKWEIKMRVHLTLAEFETATANALITRTLIAKTKGGV